jgi:transporter family-2 protein
MLMKLIFAALAVVAGIAVAFQGATNQGLLKSAGIGPALVVNTVVVLIGAMGLWLVTGAKTTFFPGSASWTLYLGGVFGFIIIAAAVLVFPRLGAAYAIALMVCGQCLAAMIIDHFGLMGMERSPATLQRVIGVGLVAAGVVVFRLSSSAASAP